MEPPSYPCDHCGHDTRRLLLCGTCENVSYCGRACQRAEWPKHKAYCRTRGQQHLRLARNAMNQTSPSWRLHRVGEYLDGVEVTDTHTPLGKVLRATRPFSVGDLVLAEMPLLVCPNKTDYCFLAAYVHADAATRAAVLELYHPPLDSPEALTFVNLAETMCTRARVWGGEMSPSLAAHLLLISQVNAHAFRAADPGIGDTVMSALHPNQSDDLPPSAVFRVASKAQNSCSPNVHYSSTSGRLE
ncbi:hypothetical protein H257_14071 [Aphanomyces astaci]|uniref:MYND-type domain-containing protein n=1 Tax=Aphanomyces astaci TaxID=112090 RepID=W4FTW1_APHAT|nr:hypothetical protein H257_14071 [Aphanomyces astaci]ETV70391.1 hypothetical protein H257_14071 [Aphanomyces astaci]|eukprot:XP_009840103.1 hypothetical protein H257_14071 [Aphanomyces astaci]